MANLQHHNLEEFKAAKDNYLTAIEIKPKKACFYYQLANLLQHFLDEFEAA